MHRSPKAPRRRDTSTVAAVGDLGDSAALGGVYKRFARHSPWVLNGVDLVLRPGMGVFVTGTNGSGKSTLLRIVAGLTRPTRGTAKRASTASFLPERQPESLRMTGTSYLDHLIVLDEPLSGLDARAQKAFHGLVTDARGTGSAILMSGHDARTAPYDFRPYELVDGRAAEHAGARLFTTSAKMVVALIGPSALDHQVLTSIPGVEIDSTGGGANGDNRRLVVVYVERTETDPFLVQAISAGWSVVSVSDTGRKGDGRDGEGASL